MHHLTHLRVGDTGVRDEVMKIRQKNRIFMASGNRFDTCKHGFCLSKQ